MKYFLIKIDYMNLFQNNTLIEENNTPFDIFLKKKYQDKNAKISSLNFYLDIFGTRIKLAEIRYKEYDSLIQLKKDAFLKNNESPNISNIIIEIIKPGEKKLNKKILFLGEENKLWYKQIKYLHIINNYALNKKTSNIFFTNIIELVIRYKYAEYLRYTNSLRKQLFFYIVFTYIIRNDFNFSSDINFGYYFFKIYKIIFKPFYLFKLKFNKMFFPTFVKNYLSHIIDILLFNVMMIFHHDMGINIFFNFRKQYQILFEKYFIQIKIDKLDYEPDLDKLINNFKNFLKGIIKKQKEENKKIQERNLNLLAIFIAIFSILLLIF